MASRNDRVAAHGYGIAISVERQDGLDDAAIEYAATLVPEMGSAGARPGVYDLGAGSGVMAERFARLGCVVVACDLLPMPSLREFARRTGFMAERHVVSADVRAVDWAEYPAANVVYSQRFLHYLRFAEAAALLGDVSARSAHCRVFFSVSGMRSELADGYPESPVARRFAPLEAAMQEKHGITHPVCLYTVDDAVQLAEAGGLAVSRLWLSEFGNVKVVAVRA